MDAIKQFRSKSSRQEESGQTLVEFALLLPVLILFIFGAMDFGRAFTAYITVNSAAREGAAYGSEKHWPDRTAAENEMESRAESDAGLIWGKPVEADAFFCDVLEDCEDDFGYSYVEVQVDYVFEPLLDIVPGLGDVDMSRTVRMRILN